MRRVPGRAANEVVKKGHANSEPVRHLLEDAGLRAVGHNGIDFEAANHGARMQDQRVGPRQPQPFRRELVEQNIFLRRDGWLVDSLGLHAQHDDRVRAFERVFDAQDPSHVGSQRLEFAGHPHGRATQSDA